MSQTYVKKENSIKASKLILSIITDFPPQAFKLARKKTKIQIHSLKDQNYIYSRNLEGFKLVLQQEQLKKMNHLMAIRMEGQLSHMVIKERIGRVKTKIKQSAL